MHCFPCIKPFLILLYVFTNLFSTNRTHPKRCTPLNIRPMCFFPILVIFHFTKFSFIDTFLGNDKHVLLAIILQIGLGAKNYEHAASLAAWAL